MATHTIHRVLHFFNFTRRIPCCWNSFYMNDNRLSFRMTKQCIKINNSNMDYCNIVGFDETPTSKKKKTFIPKITLLSEKNDMSIVTLEEAEKIAKRKNLKLVKIVDLNTKSEREIYKLMNIRDYVETDAGIKAAVREARDRTIKDEKTISLSSKISEHDLSTKIKSIHNMLRKKHGVRAVISVDGGKEKAIEVANCITEKSKDVANVTMNSAGGHTVKVILRPILNEPNNQETVGHNDSSIDNMK